MQRVAQTDISIDWACSPPSLSETVMVNLTLFAPVSSALQLPCHVSGGYLWHHDGVGIALYSLEASLSRSQ